MLVGTVLLPEKANFILLWHLLRIKLPPLTCVEHVHDDNVFLYFLWKHHSPKQQSSSQVESWNQLPLFQDLSDLSDGVGLCGLLAFYCPDELSLSELTVPTPGEPLSVSESLYNLQLVQRVCRDSLPYNVCHFSFEDILYFHESMKQNMLCFLADLYNQVELHPAPNVKLLGSSNNLIPLRPGTSFIFPCIFSLCYVNSFEDF